MVVYLRNQHPKTSAPVLYVLSGLRSPTRAYCLVLFCPVFYSALPIRACDNGVISLLGPPSASASLHHLTYHILDLSRLTATLESEL